MTLVNEINIMREEITLARAEMALEPLTRLFN